MRDQHRCRFLIPHAPSYEIWKHSKVLLAIDNALGRHMCAGDREIGSLVVCVFGAILSVAPRFRY